MTSRQIYHGLWDSKEAVAGDFFRSVTTYSYNNTSDENFPAPSDFDDLEILLAYYEVECWEGKALVIYRTKEGKIYEINGSHCSCNGLEGQWEGATEITVSYLKQKAERFLLDDEEDYRIGKMLLKLVNELETVKVQVEQEVTIGKNDRIVVLLYVLMHGYLPVRTVEALVREASSNAGAKIVYPNQDLANHAVRLALKLKEAEEETVESRIELLKNMGAWS